MSITDVLSADDIAAALQECRGKGKRGSGGFPAHGQVLKSHKIKMQLVASANGIRGRTIH